MNRFLILSLTGAGATALANLIVWLAGVAAATPGTAIWWSSWFPLYIVWMVFAIIGMGQGRNRRREQANDCPP